jgi:hypothetical protein
MAVRYKLGGFSLGFTPGVGLREQIVKAFSAAEELRELGGNLTT